VRKKRGRITHQWTCSVESRMKTFICRCVFSGAVHDVCPQADEPRVVVSHKSVTTDGGEFNTPSTPPQQADG
jgi:hypothetical protein